MKIPLILLCLQISFSKARPTDTSEYLKVSEKLLREQNLGFSEDSWDWDLVTQEKNKLSDIDSDSNDSDTSHHGGDRMFLGAMGLEALVKKDQPDLNHIEDSDITEQGKETPEKIIAPKGKDKLWNSWNVLHESTDQTFKWSDPFEFCSA
ncbi:uncharacterized protein MELLADRAFT_111798 [Melampsora larici-populina 98AG31]|uniref:Secreted protein n=1 Tax=Melampsora larici-populina (strain 98AG31 / pathotype 3-4-7) TaxID=747676 RepID=F4S4E1_MELLP|nr:uncharacterized protein MELLADRAFT_111798 [Melampsora larici-populina 98AG31]EGG00486.1 hypothetical protein MELLADRAFT_111798 [Melampsora larici-populina 98AG31]